MNAEEAAVARGPKSTMQLGGIIKCQENIETIKAWHVVFVFLFVGTLEVRREFVWGKFSYNVLDIQQVCGTSFKLQACDVLKETGKNSGIQKWTTTRQQIKTSCLHNHVILTDFFTNVFLVQEIKSFCPLPSDVADFTGKNAAMLADFPEYRSHLYVNPCGNYYEKKKQAACV